MSEQTLSLCFPMFPSNSLLSSPPLSFRFILFFSHISGEGQESLTVPNTADYSRGSSEICYDSSLLSPSMHLNSLPLSLLLLFLFFFFCLCERMLPSPHKNKPGEASQLLLASKDRFHKQTVCSSSPASTNPRTPLPPIRSLCSRLVQTHLPGRPPPRVERSPWTDLECR